ncbi:hypothetical protein Tco_0565107 [Tanacetum coccineum]
MDFIQLGGNSRVDEMILARVSSGFAGGKYGKTSKLHDHDSIPSEVPYEEAADSYRAGTSSPEYVPDPMEMEDHVPVYIPEPEHPEDLVPAKNLDPPRLITSQSI